MTIFSGFLYILGLTEKLILTVYMKAGWCGRITGIDSIFIMSYV